MLRTFLEYVDKLRKNDTLLFGDPPPVDLDKIKKTYKRKNKFEYPISNLNEIQIKRNIFAHIVGHYLLITFSTCVMIILNSGSNTSLLLRFWNVFGFIVLLCSSLSGGLFCTTILRFIRSMRYKEYITQTNKKLYKSVFSIMTISVVYFVICFLMSFVALAFFIIPFELETSVGDYSGLQIKYWVSSIATIVIVIGVTELWIDSWIEIESEIFMGKSVNLLTYIINDTISKSNIKASSYKEEKVEIKDDKNETEINAERGEDSEVSDITISTTQQPVDKYKKIKVS